MVLVPCCIWTLLWIFTHVTVASHNYQDYNALFLQRTENEWRSLWHTDCHRVCHYELDQHVDLACRVDIYRIRKRSADWDHSVKQRHIDEGKYFLHFLNNNGVFIEKSASMKFLSPVMGMRSKRNVLNECCYSKGCSWEEFAEFCQFSIRLPATNANSCT
ncbi:probable insulin-like peptide 7 [Saccostrea echinata]|uniref:probable insulin-like peptide 7 n=1 Tax=Saccostrea echinata TaxID=191078 RepID=UPI002A809827|nr:probable insulin-like peptide 7 [Saccostrea echinata]